MGQKLTLMPNGLEVQCTEILINDEKTEICQSGDSIKVIDPPKRSYVGQPCARPTIVVHRAHAFFF